MGLIDRVKNILLTPKTEWDVIAVETTPPATLVTGYVLPLAAVAAVAGYIGMSLIGSMIGSFTGVRIGLGFGLVMLVFNIVMSVVSVFVVSFIIDALAPTFGAQKNFNQALKVTAYTYTPVWVAGIANIIPLLGWLVVLIGVVYAIYLLYLGLPKVMKNPDDKTVAYMVVTLIVAIVVSVIISFISGILMSGAMFGAAALGGAGSAVTIDRDSKLGQLEDFAKKMEAAGKKMEAAEKSGSNEQKAAAAMETLATALGGGKKVEPVGIDVLKPMLPETFAGLARTGHKAEKTGLGAMMVSEAEATYTGENKRVRLQITDAGGATGLLGLGSWMGVTSEKEDQNGSERTRKEGNRMIHEKVSKTGGQNKYAVVVGDRFVVSAEGTGIDIGALKSGVNAVDLGKLESMKSAGVSN